MFKSTLPNTAILTRKELAAYTGYNISTIDRWMKLPNGEHIPYRRIGSSIRFEAADALKWMQRCGKLREDD